MLYQGSDGRVHVLGDGEELKHYKYIKKIRSGSGWRYFYTPEEIRAYYETEKNAANKTAIRENRKAQRIADRRSDAAMEKFENTTNRDVNRLKRKLKRGDITEQDIKDVAKKTGKGAAEYGKIAAKEQTKASVTIKKNNFKKHVAPILNTSKGVLKGSAPHIAKLEKGKSKTEKNYSVTTRTIKEKINGKTVTNNRSTLTSKENKLKKKYQSKNRAKEKGKVTSRTLKERVW